MTAPRTAEEIDAAKARAWTKFLADWRDLEDIERRNSHRDDILCSINQAHRGMANARARSDAAMFNYFLEKAGEHRRELAEWKAQA